MNAAEQYPQIEGFLNYIKFEKRYSQHTVLSYETDLLQFFSFLISQYDGRSIKQVSQLMVRSWLAELREDAQVAKTINRKISTLKSFFKFAVRSEWIIQSPAATIISPKMSKRLPQFVEQNDIETLLTHVEFSDNFRGTTEKLMLEFFYHCGLRVSELINLKITQVDFSNCQVKILGKGNKERIIPLQPALLQRLQQYVNDWPKDEALAANVFVNKKYKAFNRREVYEIVKRNLSYVTTIQKKSPHILRHSFATHLSSNGADINAVKELLGHSSLAATQVYIHNNIEKLKEAYKSAHPKA